jgi:hypothetical protein
MSGFLRFQAGVVEILGMFCGGFAEVLGTVVPFEEIVGILAVFAEVFFSFKLLLHGFIAYTALFGPPPPKHPHYGSIEVQG